MPIDVTINGNERGDSMSYVIKYENPDRIDGEEIVEVKGTASLEKFTDERIMNIHYKAKAIYKVYDDSTAIVLFDKEYGTC